ncbi:Transporter, MFS superfamily [Streptococcus pyogenes MGAS2096]|nr:Transporter, MFS superfamily [Streptococcus pyogenes MGAS2096]
MSTLSLDTTNKRALVAAIAASGTDDLNVMFLAFSMSSIMTDLGLSGTQGALDCDHYQFRNVGGRPLIRVAG